MSMVSKTSTGGQELDYRILMISHNFYNADWSQTCHYLINDFPSFILLS